MSDRSTAKSSQTRGKGRGTAVFGHIPRHRTEALIAAAREYLARGWQPVPIPPGRKGPVTPGWQHLRIIPETLASAFLGAGNLGLLLGRPSGDLVDIDLDSPEARDLADAYLPATPALTGRPSSPRSHRWYISPGLQTVRHRDPLTHASILELRGTGSQTLVGPSLHPSGEPYDALRGDPALVSSGALTEAVRKLATEVIRRRHGDRAPQPTTPRSAPPTPVQGGIPRPHLLRRASAYLGAIPPAISGQGGHNLTYTAAVALVHGFGLTPNEAQELLLREYNPRCQPPWSERELKHKVTDAATRPHRQRPGWLLV